MTDTCATVVEGEVVHPEPVEEKPARRRRTVTVPTELLVPQQTADPETPNTLVRLAVQQNFDLEKLEKLLQLQRDWQKEEARKAFFTALSKFQSELPPIVKADSADMGRAGRRHYASLGTINEVIRPYLYANGLSFRFRQQQGPEGITVTCIVSHRDGHSEETTLTAGADASGGKNTIQSVGSTVTYLCRYTLVSALGLTTVEDDDDGEQNPAPAPEPRRPTALELAQAAAAAGAAQASPNAASPAVPPPPVQKIMITSQQMAEMVGTPERPGLLRQLFSSGDAASNWLLENYGMSDPRELTETEAMGVLSALNLLKHEMTKPTPPPPAAEPEQPPQPQPNGKAQQWQRDRIRELTCALWGDKANEHQAEWLRILGYGSAQSLTFRQAADRVVELERLAGPKEETDSIPF